MKKLLIISLLLFGCETISDGDASVNTLRTILQNDESISLERDVSTNSTNMILYDVGDVMSITDQNTEFDVCYGDYESNTFSFADLNGELNGGHYYITFVDMAATW